MRHAVLVGAIVTPCVLGAASCGEGSGPEAVAIECDTPRAAVTGASGQGGSTVAAVLQLAIAPCPVDLGRGAVTVTFTLTARDLPRGLASVLISGTTPGGIRPACSAATPESGTARDGRWQCAWVLNQYAEPGVWTVGATVWDSAGKLDTLDTTLPVANTLADSTPPVLTGIAFPDGPATAGAETRPLSITGADSAAGMWRVEVWGVQGDPAYDWSCSMEAGVWPAGPPPSPDTWRPLVEYSPGCPMPLQESSTPVMWTIRRLELIDLRKNRRTYEGWELQRAGFITQFDVSK